MKTHSPADHRAVRSASVWVLASTLAVGGCSASSEASRGASVAQPSPNISAATTSSSTSSATSTPSAFKQDSVDSAFAKKLGALCNEWNAFASSHQYPGAANPQAATVEELPKIGAWLDSLTINHELVARTTGLGTPGDGDYRMGPRPRRLRSIREGRHSSRGGGQDTKRPTLAIGRGVLGGSEGHGP